MYNILIVKCWHLIRNVSKILRGSNKTCLCDECQSVAASFEPCCRAAESRCEAGKRCDHTWACQGPRQQVGAVDSSRELRGRETDKAAAAGTRRQQRIATGGNGGRSREERRKISPGYSRGLSVWRKGRRRTGEDSHPSSLGLTGLVVTIIPMERGRGRRGRRWRSGEATFTHVETKASVDYPNRNVSSVAQ